MPSSAAWRSDSASSVSASGSNSTTTTENPCDEVDRLYPLHPVYGVLDRLRYLLVNQIGSGACHGGRDGYDREGDVGQELLVEARRRIDPAPDEQDRRQDDYGLVPETPTDDPLHQISSPVAAPKLWANSLRPLTKARASPSVILLMASCRGRRRSSTMRPATSRMPAT